MTKKHPNLIILGVMIKSNYFKIQFEFEAHKFPIAIPKNPLFGMWWGRNMTSVMEHGPEQC